MLGPQTPNLSSPPPTPQHTSPLTPYRVYGVSVEERKDMGSVGECTRLVGKCVGVWGEVKRDSGSGAPIHFLPHFPTSPPHILTFLYISPYGPLSPPTPQHTFLYLSPHLPSSSQSVAKSPSDKVSGNHEYYVYGHFNTTCTENKVKIDKSVICKLLQQWVFLRVDSFMFFRSGNTMVMFNVCTLEWFLRS